MVGLVVEDDTWCYVGEAGKWWHVFSSIAALLTLNYADVGEFDGGSWFSGRRKDAMAWFHDPVGGIMWQIEVWDVWTAGWEV